MKVNIFVVSLLIYNKSVVRQHEYVTFFIDILVNCKMLPSVLLYTSTCIGCCEKGRN